MLEGGSRVPFIVNWFGTTPQGRVNNDLTDLSDFFVTFAELAGAKLPQNVMLDGHSLTSQIRGQKGTPREWVYVELSGKSYVRNARFKLTNQGELFDLANAPFLEQQIAPATANSVAVAARRKLQTILDEYFARSRRHSDEKLP
jgi:arylsulfatase A